ncbi:MAG: hypothetical protein SH808_13300 [Saprospiraceae bacterium]|nr:hypothetical protein [Saprospiraceae bacterium]
MNLLHTFTKGHARFGIYAAITSLVLLSSCATKSPFLTSDVIPSARGYVKVNKDNNENYIIQVSLEHLAEAKRLNPSKATYVIWMESDGNSTKNIGQINSASNPNNLKASFKTSSSFKPIRIFITAEDDGTTSYPGSQIVLSTNRLKG